MSFYGIADPIVIKRLEEASPVFAKLPEEKRGYYYELFKRQPYEKQIDLLKEITGLPNADTIISWLQTGQKPKGVEEYGDADVKPVPLMEDPVFFIAEPFSSGHLVGSLARKAIGTISNVFRGTGNLYLYELLKGLGEAISESGHPTLGLAAELGGHILLPAATEKASGKLFGTAARAISKKVARKTSSRFWQEIHQAFNSINKARQIRGNDISELERVFGNLEYLSTKHPELKPLYERELKRIAARHEDKWRILYAKGKGIVDRFGNSLLKGLKPEEKALLNKLLEIGDRYQGFNKLVHIKGLGKSYRIPEDQLRAWNVPERVIDAYNRTRNVLDASKNHLIAFLAKNRTALGMDKEELARITRAIANSKGYFPRVRIPESYWVIAKDANTGKTLWREAAKPWEIEGKTQAVLEKIKADPFLRKFKPKIELERYTDPFPEGAVFERPTATSNVGALLESLKEQGRFDPQTIEAIKEELGNIFKARGFGKHFLHRSKDYIGGYETNMLDVLPQYVSGLTGYTHKLMAARDFAKQLRDMPALRNPKLFAYANDYVRTVLENTTKSDRAYAFLRQMAYGYHLVAKPAFAVINATQNIITAKPYISMLAKRLGVREAPFAKAMKDTVLFGVKHTLKHLAPDEQQAMLDALHKGVLKAQFIPEMLAKDTGVKSKVATVLEKLSLPAEASEFLNRGSTFLAAYRTLKQKLPYQEALEGAIRATEKTQFVYGKANLPQWATKPIGRTWLTLRQYTLHYLNFLKELLSEKEYRAFLKSIGALGILGGLESYPLVKTALHLLRTKEGIDLQSEIEHKTPLKHLPPDTRQKIMQTVLHGVPTALGVDLSPSLQVDIPFANVESYRDALEELMGPGGVALWRTGQGLGQLLIDPTLTGKLKGLEKALPAALRHPAKAIEVSTRGMTTSSGLPVREPRTQEEYRYKPGEAVTRALGFTPASETQLWEDRKRYRDIQEYDKQQRYYLYKSLREALYRGGNVGRIIQQIVQHNQWAVKHGLNPIDLRAVKTALIEQERKQRQALAYSW